MNDKNTEKGQPAFLLAQIGAHAASLFGERLTALELTPPDAGILRLLRIAAGISQQELSTRLQIHLFSSVGGLVDATSGLVELLASVARIKQRKDHQLNWYVFHTP